MTVPSPRRRRIQFLSALILLFSWITTPANAIYASQAGVVDWHHTWMGKAHWSALTDSSRLVVSTERSMLASIDTETGAIVWRQELQDPVGEFQADSSGVLTFSSTGAQLWGAASGRLVWERTGFEGVLAGRMLSNRAVIVDKQHVAAIDLTDGRTLWTHKRAADHELAALHHHDNDNTANTVYLVERPASQDAFVAVGLDIDTGKPVSSNKLTTQKMVDNLTPVGKYVLWTEKDTIRWNELGTKKIQKTTVSSLVGSLASFASAEPETVRLDSVSDTVFLSAFNIADNQLTVSVAALRMQESGLSLVQDLGIQESIGAVDTLAGTTVHFARTSDKELTWHIVSDGAYQKTRVAHDFSLTGNVAYAKLVSNEPMRALVVTASGSTFLYDGSSNELVWSREEAMAHATASEFLELPEKQLWTQMADEIAEEHPETIPPLTRYIHRLQAHATEATQLPQWIIQRVMGAVQTGKAQPADARALLQAQQTWTNTTTPGIVYRDAFGLHKLVLTVTDTGKVIAQNTADRGSIVWSRYFEDVRFSHVEMVRSVSVKMPPLIVVVGMSGSPSLGYEETHLYRLNALTGEDYISHLPEADMYFEPQLITETKIAKVMRLPIEEPDEHTHVLALYEAGTSRVYIYPDTEGARQRFSEFTHSFYFMHPAKNSNGFRGYHPVEGYRGSLTAKPVWTLDLPADEQVVAVGERQPYEKVALLGRVLGNRNVLYKYLNPHMFAVLSRNSDKATLTVRLVDGVKGTVLYETMHRNVDAVHHAVHVVQAEHWVIYHFWSTDTRTRGYQAVVLELYEGEWENERVVGTNFSSYDNIRPHVQSSAFVFPYAVQTIGVTTTRSGVSTREILFGLPSHQIFGVNKGFFDPRRPRDKPTKDDQEEGLMPYAPIPDERRMFLTYDREVLGIKRILTSPALLESTSLVFAYGLDTFFTQSSPSRQFDVLSEDFSKSQLILTMVGLVVAITIARPIVRRKRVNALWQ